MDRFNDALPEDDYRPDGFAECAQCLSMNNPEDCSLLAGKYLCWTCFDPKQPAADLIIVMVERLEARAAALRVEWMILLNELKVLKMAKGRAAA